MSYINIQRLLCFNIELHQKRDSLVEIFFYCFFGAEKIPFSKTPLLVNSLSMSI